MAGHGFRLARPVVGSLAVVLVTVTVLASCGDDDAADDAGGSTDDLEDVVVLDGPEADVNVIDNTFDAQNIQIPVGTTVVWTNNGRQDHDIVPVDDGAGFGVDATDFAPDAAYEYTFEQSGTYRYYCSLHGTASAGMNGAVIVQDQ